MSEVTLPHRVLHGNVWAIRAADPMQWIVIPTNVGWTRTGANVMGAGLAKQARARFPGLPGIYGDFLRTAWRSGTLDPARASTALFRYAPGKLLLFPSKPLNVEAPHASWQGPAVAAFIEEGVTFLASWGRAHSTDPKPHRNLLVPLIGAGNGGLDPAVSRILLQPLLDFGATLVLESPCPPSM